MKLWKWAASLLALLVVATLAWAKLQRASIRAAEASAIADTKEVIVAEQSFASANGGYFDDIARLCRQGPSCVGIGIPDYPADAPEFLDPELARPSPYRKDHYLREWLSGPSPTMLPESVSPTSVLDYCYSSTPGNWLVRHGRSFSGTAMGTIEEDPLGRPIPCPVPYSPHPLE